MTATAHKMGHKVAYIDGRWSYLDDLSDAEIERACVKCGLMQIDGYDPCIGYVEGAISVCCGHGVNDPILLRSEP